MKKIFILIFLAWALLSCNNKLEIIYFDLAPKSITMYSTEEKQLSASVSYSGKDSLDLVWSSSNTEVAMVNKYGMVTAMQPGTATITIECEGLQKSCEITVQQETYIPITATSGKLHSVFLWKNGNLSQISGSLYNAISENIFVNKTNVYIAGTANITTGEDTIPHACYWKNGAITILPDDSTSIGNSVVVTGDSIFICGASTSKTNVTAACYWLNGAKQELGDTGSVNDIKVCNGTVYNGGYIVNGSDTLATIWKDEKLSTLSGGNGIIKSIHISPNEIYAVGYIIENNIHKAALWKNGELTILCPTSSEANGISLYNGNIYISYNKTDTPLNSPNIWTPTGVIALSNNGSENFCYGVGVTSQGIFVAGCERKYIINQAETINNPLLWIQNKISYLVTSPSDMKPTGIYVR